MSVASVRARPWWACQRLPGGEMAVQRAGAHPRQEGEIIEAQVEEASVVEDLPGLGDQGLTVALGVDAQRLGVGHAGLPLTIGDHLHIFRNWR